VGRQWRALAEDAKEKYENGAKADKRRYQNELNVEKEKHREVKRSRNES